MNDLFIAELRTIGSFNLQMLVNYSRKAFEKVVNEFERKVALGTSEYWVFAIWAKDVALEQTEIMRKHCSNLYEDNFKSLGAVNTT